MLRDKVCLLLGLGAVALGVGGCNTFDVLSDTSVQGVVIGAAITDGETPLSGGPALGVFFLAEANSINDFSQNLIVDADSVTLGDGDETADLASADDGVWSTDLEDDTLLQWRTGETFTLEMERDGRSFAASVEAPPPPALSGLPSTFSVADLPDDWAAMTQEEIEQLIAEAAASGTHEAGESLALELGDDYEYWIVVVVSREGEITFSNVPEEAGPFLSWVLTDEPITAIEIPGTAFPDPSELYGIGVAGIEFTQTANYSGFNWLISNVGAGTMTVSGLLTGEAR